MVAQMLFVIKVLITVHNVYIQVLNLNYSIYYIVSIWHNLLKSQTKSVIEIRTTVNFIYLHLHIT